ASPRSSSAPSPDSALSARSPLTLARPSLSSSPAALAALRTASPASRAACLRWLLASPRLVLTESVEVVLIAESPVGGVEREEPACIMDCARGASARPRPRSLQPDGAARAPALDHQHQVVGRFQDRKSTRLNSSHVKSS